VAKESGMGEKKRRLQAEKGKFPGSEREPHVRPAFLVVWYEGDEKRGKFFDDENAAHCFRITKVIDEVSAAHRRDPNETAEETLQAMKLAMTWGAGQTWDGKEPKTSGELFVSPVIDPKAAAELEQRYIKEAHIEAEKHLESAADQDDGEMVEVPLPPEAMELLRMQHKRFIKKFGREPGPHDPVFFDDSNDTPVPIDPDELRRVTLEALKKSGVAPELVYAYAKTGFIVNERGYTNMPPEDRAEYEAAIEEYFALEAEGGDKEKN
jgi:hypothetical protein